MTKSISQRVAWLLPPKVLLWAVVRAFADASTGDNSNKILSEISYHDVYLSIKKKYNISEANL